MKRRRAAALSGLLVSVLVLASCTSDSNDREVLTIFAASSLTEAFSAVEKRFEQEHSSVDIQLNFAGSAKLAQQIIEGAPAEVFAAADQNTMDKVVKAGRVVDQPKIFATNRLIIAVAPGNPRGIRSFADLNRAGITVVVCAPQVPCGAATQRVEQNTGVTLRPVSEETDVKAVKTKVQSGEVDAGLVYVTDVAASRKELGGIDFVEAGAVLNDYPIALLSNGRHTELAQQFTDFVLGPIGVEELRRVGFVTPAT